jgi:serine/threonine protein kinase
MNVLGHYLILDQLGAGATGTVFRAKDTVLNREVALKTIQTAPTADPEIRRRFYREARAGTRLQHPNIVPVFEVGEIDRIAFISMELLHGSDLRRLIDNRDPIPLAAKLDAMIQICAGLDHAHRHGVFHRDIKPGNLFLQDDRRVRVVDFGIARLPSSRLTVQSGILGTPNYMAPEQILGKPADARSDLFSAGLVFFELLVYAHPFQSKMIHTRIVEGRSDSLLDYDPTLPVPLVTILTRTLAKSPAERYQTGAELAADLEAVLERMQDGASPFVSKLQLPSQRIPIRRKRIVEGNRTLLRPVPPGEDPAEWRLTEALRLGSQFDEAIEHSDGAAAYTALEELTAIAAEDDRFALTVDHFRQRYASCWGQVPASACLPMAAAAASADGGTRISANAALPYDTPPEWETSPWTNGSSSPPMEQPAQMTNTGLFGLTNEQKKLAVGLVAACIAIILLASVLSRFWRVIPEVPAIGIVAVTAERTYIKTAADANSEVVAESSRGEHLRLINLPPPSAKWVHVQAGTGGNLTAPGYIPITDVANWNDWSLDSVEDRVRLTLNMCPEASAPVTDLQACLERMRGLQAGAAGTAVEQVLRTKMGQVEQVIAARQSVAAPADPVVEPPKPPPLTPDQLVARGRNALDGAHPNPQRARYYANEALKIDQKNAGALALLDDVRQYIAVFGTGNR